MLDAIAYAISSHSSIPTTAPRTLELHTVLIAEQQQTCIRETPESHTFRAYTIFPLAQYRYRPRAIRLM